jgi:Stress up-regulated Nod 19
MRKLLTLLTAAVAAAFVLVAPASNPVAAATGTVKTVSYGPFTVGAASMDMPTMYDTLRFGVSRPCVACYLTSMQARLRYANGTTANYDTGIMLHHVVLASQWQKDVTCSGTPLGLAGQRFFASGNERTLIDLPPGYGYPVHWYDSWNMLVSLMNMMSMSQTVYVDVTFTYQPSWASVQTVKPVWLDIDECGDSEYSIPAGPSDTAWSWTSTLAGQVVFAAGHQHDYGVHLSATDTTTGSLICDSVAGYGTKAAYMGHIESMSTCGGTGLPRLHTGDGVVLHSYYNSPEPKSDVMGIMLLYVRPTG